MKKSSFVAMLMGTISGVLFALGMCMALIPEWALWEAPPLIMERENWDRYSERKKRRYEVL